MYQKNIINFILLLAVLAVVSGCTDKKPISNQTVINPVDEKKGVDVATSTDELVDEVDNSVWEIYEDEGYTLKYPINWNIYKKENGDLYELFFTYDEIKNGIEPIDNMVGLKVALVDYEKSCFIQDSCSCLKNLTCDEINEMVINDTEWISYEYTAIGFGNQKSLAVSIKLNDDYVLLISGEHDKVDIIQKSFRILK